MTDLLDLSRADITSKRPGRRKTLLEQISALADRVDVLAEADAKLPPLPGGVGNAIMEAFELAPSRLIGDLKRALEAAIERGELEARREDAYYVAHIARQTSCRTSRPRSSRRSSRPAATSTARRATRARTRASIPTTRRRACSRAATIPTTIRACIATRIPTIPSCTATRSL